MRKKGFTLIELLVVIAIIAMLLAILMPALSKVKKIAQRVICGTNLKGLGTAQAVYINDNKEEFAIQGQNQALELSDRTDGWDIQQKSWSNTSQGTTITVGASLYLLVRTVDVPVKTFICPSSDQKEFTGKNTGGSGGASLDIVELWDFGHVEEEAFEGPQKTQSYSYHMPYEGGGDGKIGIHKPTPTRPSAFALMADRNPWLDPIKVSLRTVPALPDYIYQNTVCLFGAGSNPPVTTDFTNVIPKWSILIANSFPHAREGQNVLYADGHSSWEIRPDVGETGDNIYTNWSSAIGTAPTESDRRKGTQMNSKPLSLPAMSTNVVGPKDAADSVLVND